MKKDRYILRRADTSVRKLVEWVSDPTGGKSRYGTVRPSQLANRRRYRELRDSSNPSRADVTPDRPDRGVHVESTGNSATTGVCAVDYLRWNCRGDTGVEQV